MKSQLLLKEYPIVIQPTLATLVGLNEAILLQQIEYWCNINKRKANNIRDGHYWTYNSIKSWHNQLPFMSESTIKRTLKNLETRELIVTGTFNKRGYDRTKWYRVNHNQINILYKTLSQECPHQETFLSSEYESTNLPLGQLDQLEEFSMTQPIPETITKTNEKDTEEDTSEMCIFKPNSNTASTFAKANSKAKRDDIETKSFINTYMNDYYVQRFHKQHPALKKEQYFRVYDTIEPYIDELGIEYLSAMAEEFFNEVKQSNWNINHFATEGILDILQERVM